MELPTPTRPAAAPEIRRDAGAAAGRAPPPAGSGFRIGRIFGIDLRLEGSWFVIFALLILSFAGNLDARHPGLAPAAKWTLAAGTSLLFFGSILLHELAHSLVAVRKGIRVHDITLLLFGGVSHLAGEPKRPKDDLEIAVVGPLTSAVLGLLFLGAARLLSAFPVAASMSSWLGIINLGLAAFNLLPGFPLDGGRILKALIWMATGNAGRAYRLSIAAGRLLAYGMIFGGLLLALELKRTTDGIWIALMGWYLLSNARAGRLQLTLSGILKRHRVRDVMRAPEAVVQSGVPVSDAVEEWVLRKGRRALLVCEEGRLLGLVTLHEIKKVPREDWSLRPVGRIMIPSERLETVVPDQSLLLAFQRMNEHSVSQLPVLGEGGALAGVVGREDVLRLLGVHTEMGMPDSFEDGEEGP
ncbi:MAG: site-2 protease family protein [Planctomycetes bacterium]|nr:site-2 protease family protein [Planctomycetota bacterium]